MNLNLNKLLQRDDFESKILMAFIVINPLIDILYTFIGRYQDSISINQLIRMLFLLYFVWRVKDNKKVIILLATILLVGMIAPIIYLRSNDVFMLKSDVLYISKLIYTLSVYYVFLTALDRRTISKDTMTKLLVYSVSIISIVIFISAIAGIGEATYSYYEVGGTKGLFNAQNEIVAALVVTLPLNVYLAIKNINWINILLLLINIGAGFLIGTKTALIISLFSAALFILLAIINIKDVRKKIIIVSLILILGLILFAIFNEKITKIYQYQVHNFIQRDLITYLLSGRNWGANAALKIMNEKGNFITYLLGFGYTNGRELLAPKTPVLIEMDYLELLFYSGIIVLMIFLTIVLYNIIRQIRGLNKSFLNWIILVSCLFGLIISFLGGHVLFSGIAGSYFSLVYALGFKTSTKDINYKESSMKNLFIIGSKGIPANYGGFETFVDKLTEYKSSANLKYHVSCMSDNNDEFVYNSARCFNVKVPKIGSAQAVIYDVLALRRCIKFVKENKIDGAIIYILACRIGPFMSLYKKKIESMGIKLYINPDGHEWKRSKWNALIRKYWLISERLMVKNSDLIICDSIAIENYIKERYLKYNPTTTYIAYGADSFIDYSDEDQIKFNEWAQNNNINSKDYYLIVGRFVPENNYELMIREFMTSKAKKDLVIITDISGKYYDKLKDATGFLSDKRIKFVGTIYDSHLLAKVRENAFAYLHGHEVGGTNPSLLEALSFTALNILLDVSFNKEVGGNGAVFFSKSCGSLVSTMERVESMSGDEINVIASNAKKIISSRYTWSGICKKYEELFLEDIISKQDYSCPVIIGGKGESIINK